MSREQGNLIEDKAQKHLAQQGLKPVDKNYLCRSGEIDLIMIDNNTLVFVEVRYRKNSKFGSAAESVNWQKQQKLIKTAQHFIQSQKKWQNLPCRFDVVACQNDNTEALDFDWIKNAFEPG